MHYLTHSKLTRIKSIIDSILSMNLSLEYKQALPINSSQLAAWCPAGPGTLSMHVA